MSDGESILNSKDANGEKWFLEVNGEDLTEDMTINPISKADPCRVKWEGAPRWRRTWCLKESKGGVRTDGRVQVTLRALWRVPVTNGTGPTGSLPKTGLPCWIKTCKQSAGSVGIGENPMVGFHLEDGTIGFWLVQTYSTWRWHRDQSHYPSCAALMDGA